MFSAFFSGTELALMSLPKHKVESLVKQKRFWSKALSKIKENNDRLLITVLIWNNLVNVYTAALATTIAISIWEASGFEQATAVWIATWIVTFLLLLFWEIIPKSIATKNATSVSLLVAPIYKFLLFALYPIIIFMEAIIKIFSWKWKMEKISEEELESFIDMGKKSWTLEKKEHEKIKNILEFWDITVENIMTPRVKIEALDINTTVWEAKKFYLSHTHSRIPLYNKTIDKIDHFITIRDILNKDDSVKLTDVELTKVLKAPLNQPIDILLEWFQKAHKHLAIAIDEYGGVAGLITLEDIIEEIIWEVRDETDKEVDEITKVSEDTYVIKSLVLIEDILAKFHLTITEIWLNKNEFEWETVSYIITHKLERFPNKWEELEFDVHDWEESKWKIIFKTLWIEEGKIDTVEVKRVI